MRTALALSLAAIMVVGEARRATADPARPDPDAAAAKEEPGPAVRVGVFDVDASPPVGSPLAYDPTKEAETPLSCRGVV